tara:strand:+ start:607 stop:1317 length:711 start_codon:yes stop_codon:yes gene_type:complete
MNDEKTDYKDKIIESLKEENIFLKGKLEGQVETCERMMGFFTDKETKPKTKTETSCEPYVIEFLKSLELDVNESLTETVAELRTKDDNDITVTLDNAYECFVFNDNNNLPYIKSFSDIDGKTEHVLSDVIIEKVLKNCSVDITEPYRGRFKLYSNGKWLEVSASRDILFNMMNELFSHYKKYLKLLKFYYTYDSTCKCIDEDQCSKIQPLLKSILRRLNDQADLDEEIKYILNKLA